MILQTGSQLDRVVRCEASGALPQIIDASEPEDEEDDWRGAGKAKHDFLDRAGAVGREEALAESDDRWRPVFADIDLAKLANRLQFSREAAFAYDFIADTARRLHPVAHRAYEVDPTCEIPFTIDLAGFDSSTRIGYAGDYKGPHAWLPAPDQSLQLGVAAVAISRLFGARQVDLEYIRILDDGSVLPWRKTLDGFAIDDAAEKIGKAVRRLPILRAEIRQGVVPDVVEGPWCRYCPSKAHCPAKTAEIRALLATPESSSYLVPITAENATQAYSALRRAKSALKQFEAGIYAYAKTTPISLGSDEGGGERFFGELRRPGNEQLDGAVAHRVLTDRYDGDAANDTVTMEVTKSAITDTVRKRIAKLPESDRPKQTHEVTTVLDAIRKAGGASNPETKTTTEYVVAPEGATKASRRKAG